MGGGGGGSCIQDHTHKNGGGTCLRVPGTAGHVHLKLDVEGGAETQGAHEVAHSVARAARLHLQWRRTQR